MFQPQAQYGGVQFANPVIKSPSPFLHGTRRAMNSHAIALMYCLPWLLFLLVYLICATAFRYDRKELCWDIYYGALAIVVVTWLLAARSWKRKLQNDPYRQPSWLLVAAVLLTLAFVCGTVFGDMNFWYHTQPAHDLENLNTYGNDTRLDPSFTKGQEVMDAGRIFFSQGAHLDLSKSMTFKNLDNYCVAPITIGTEQLRSYDYWAIGVDCCSAGGNHFRCGEFANPRARAGLRLMKDDQRPFFRLAVQQAESSYGIKSEHPIFLDWMVDPSLPIIRMHENAYWWHVLAVLGYFVFNVFCVTVTVVFFSKLGRY